VLSVTDSSGVQFCLEFSWQSSGVQWSPVLCQYIVSSPVEYSEVQFCIGSLVESSFVLSIVGSPVESSGVQFCVSIQLTVQRSPVESSFVLNLVGSPVESSGVQFCVSIWLTVQWSPVESSFVSGYG